MEDEGDKKKIETKKKESDALAVSRPHFCFWQFYAEWSESHNHSYMMVVTFKQVWILGSAFSINVKLDFHRNVEWTITVFCSLWWFSRTFASYSIEGFCAKSMMDHTEFKVVSGLTFHAEKKMRMVKMQTESSFYRPFKTVFPIIFQTSSTCAAKHIKANGP